jgi:hypothetical protein
LVASSKLTDMSIRTTKAVPEQALPAQPAWPGYKKAERASLSARRHGTMRESHGEVASFLLACSGCLGMFKALGLQVQGIQTMLWVGIGVCAILLLLLNLRRPQRLLTTLILIPLLVVVGYGLVYGVMWYFITYLPSKGPLIELAP